MREIGAAAARDCSALMKWKYSPHYSAALCVLRWNKFFNCSTERLNNDSIYINNAAAAEYHAFCCCILYCESEGMEVSENAHTFTFTGGIRWHALRYALGQ